MPSSPEWDRRPALHKKPRLEWASWVGASHLVSVAAMMIGAAFAIPIFNMINSIDLLAGYLIGGLLLLSVIAFLFIRPKDLSTHPVRGDR
jgi:high-affinity Fe2+/Pb2+ permease